MHWTNITTTIVGESTQIVNRIKSLTVPCGSRLMLIFFSSGHWFFCRLLVEGTACSPEMVCFPTGCSYFDSLGWPGLRNVNLFGFRVPAAVCRPRLGQPGLRNAKLLGFPSGSSFLDREHNLGKILIRHQIHSTKNVKGWNSTWLLASLIEMIRRWDGVAYMIVFTWTVMLSSCVSRWEILHPDRGHAWRYVSRRTAAHTRTFGAVWTRP